MVHNHSEYPSSEKATFSQFLHHKRSSKSHPRAESVSSVASSLARSQSTGRNPRMLDIRNAYTSRSLAADQSDVQSVSSQASLLSGWSDLGSVSTSFLSGVSGTTGRHPPCPPTIQEDDNDLEVMSLYSSAPSSLQTQLSSWRPLTGEKRKFSSIAEAISDSDEEADPGGGAAKRPRTPLALPEPGPGARPSLLSSLRAAAWRLVQLLVRAGLVLAALFSCVLVYTGYKNYQCSAARDRT